MTLKEAIKRAEYEAGGIIDNVLDCGDKWALTFSEISNKLDENDDEISKLLNQKTGFAAAVAYKNTDRFEYCSGYDYMLLLKNGVEIGLPN